MGRDQAAAARRPLERVVVMDDDHAVARQVDVELEPLRATGDAVIERLEGVLRPERRTPPMGVDDGHARHLSAFAGNGPQSERTHRP